MGEYLSHRDATLKTSAFFLPLSIKTLLELSVSSLGKGSKLVTEITGADFVLGNFNLTPHVPSRFSWASPLPPWRVRALSMEDSALKQRNQLGYVVARQPASAAAISPINDVDNYNHLIQTPFSQDTYDNLSPESSSPVITSGPAQLSTILAETLQENENMKRELAIARKSVEKYKHIADLTQNSPENSASLRHPRLFHNRL